jgi:hypothetical protein
MGVLIKGMILGMPRLWLLAITAFIWDHCRPDLRCTSVFLASYIPVQCHPPLRHVQDK